jgi:hypothetical protein
MRAILTRPRFADGRRHLHCFWRHRPDRHGGRLLAGRKQPDQDSSGSRRCGPYAWGALPETDAARAVSAGRKKRAVLRDRHGRVVLGGDGRLAAGEQRPQRRAAVREDRRHVAGHEQPGDACRVGVTDAVAALVPLLPACS